MCCSIHSGCGGVLRTLRVGGSEDVLGAQRPGGPRLPGGGPHFSREMGRKRAGSPVIGRWLRWNRCRVDPATWVPRRLRRGSPTFFEESRGKEHQGQAPGPRFYSRSFPLADFCSSCLCNGRGAISSGMLRPIWGAFSGKNRLESIFAKESSQIRARTWAPK